ncbi:SLATT domain-containing protein [Micromonospora rubida]|uniref:SLATT domain-containing protein n=1 Tax=Micromonospora rubida TaxID=2697657 RepID=UPI001376BC09|nr:SLATT domain-containing protein [Micromonospora rubida]NBE82740.1 SLATT domain-containing protein [Micromonospora rubida]
MTESLPDALSPMLERLEKRSYTTYLCRLNASRRLSHANIAWNLALVALSTSTAIASVGLLAKRDMYGVGGDALMVSLSILSLVASLVVSGAGYGTRARAMEDNYKRIQQISVAAENLKEYAGPDRQDKGEKLQWEYEVAVASTENHTSRDFHKVQSSSRGGTRSKAKRLHDLAVSAAYSSVTLLPYASLVVPILILIPFSTWFFNGI